MAATTAHQDDSQMRAQTPVSAPTAAPTPTPAPAPEPAPTPIYQTPDWEIPTNYPPPKRSFRNSLTFLNTAAAAAAAAVASRNPNDNNAAAAEAAAAESATAKETTAAPAPAPVPAPEPGSSDVSGGGVAAAAPKPSLATAMRQRLDAALPPHKKYVFGRRSRRFLLLGIVLPAAVLTFVVLPLAVGLGVGLSRRSHRSSSQNLPLPDDDNDGGVFTGELTYYDVGLGACGTQSSDGDAICSISHLVFDAAGSAGGGGNPNANPLCGRKIRITRDYSDVEAGAGNRSVDVTVVDRCTGCGPTDLDLSPAAFEMLALRDSGRVVGSWAWLGE
ncbi:hypothetical protein SLS62_008981 [Diatrype stigma]|uniref:RlpA-like protein double-psi beta-barrel domain-containing protein n=1 Tax=Diatrype stigma TaxID=117547 RepID=A0AAN9UJH8_9PEZI